MIIDSPIVSGSQLASGPLTQIGNVEITGSLSVTGTINGSITGSVTSASYATSAEFLDGLDSTSFVFTSSFNTFSGSAAGRITNLEAFSSSLDATFATDASVSASILVLSQSVQASEAALSSSYTITSGSYASASGSLSIRTTNLEATSSTLVAASSSFAADSASLSTRLTGDEANITTLTNASASFAAQSASLSTRLTTDESNFDTTSGSLSTRVTNLESTSSTVSSSFATTSGSISGRVTLIEGQYATTGSNVFTGPQFINQASNAIGFASTASLYTDGGLRVSKDSFVSGTAYFNNVVVYGTSSIQYITSSQVNFGTNIITVNTDTPAVRFGGLAVFDSGSTQLTGSMLWDSERNHWIYSNPSGSTYNSAMLMNGPRNTGSLGSEQGTTSCALMMGQGGDHITSSMIYSYGNATCFYGQSYISGSGDACYSGVITSNISTAATACSTRILVSGCIGIGGTLNPSNPLHIYTDTNSNSSAIKIQNATACISGSVGIEFQLLTDFCDYKKAEIRAVAASQYANEIDLAFWSGGSSAGRHAERMRILATGETCFACTVCSNGLQSSDSLIIRKDASVDNRYIQLCNTQTGGYRWDLVTRSTAQGCGFGILNNTTSQYALLFDANNIVTFACQVCAPAAIFSGCVGIGTTSAYTSRLNVQSSSPSVAAIKAGYGAVSGNGYTVLADNYTLTESLIAIGVDYSSGGLVLGSIMAPSTTNQGCFISTQAQFGGYGSAIRLNTSGEIYFYNGTQNSVITTGCAKTASIALTIAQTGAATFASNVQATTVSVGGTATADQLSINNGTSNSYATLRLAGSNRGGQINFYNQSYPTAQITVDQSGNVDVLTGVFAGSSVSSKFSIANTGAATFTCTILANGGNITSFSSTGSAAFGNGISIHTQPGTYTAGHGGILQFQNEDVITAGIRGIRDGGSWGGALLFYTHNTTAGNTLNSTFLERMRIDTTGVVTINSTYFVPLKINTTYGQVGLEFQLNGTGFGGVGSANNFSSDAGILATDTGIGTNGSATNKLVFATGAGYSTRMVVLSNGNVGIGTTSPSHLLDVSGATRTGTLAVSNGATTTWCVGRINDARVNTWYTIYTWTGIYDGAFALAQLGYEDNNGDGANAHAFWMTTGPAYATGFGTYQIGGATNLCLQRSGQSLQALITGVTDRTGGAFIGYTVQTMNVAS